MISLDKIVQTVGRDQVRRWKHEADKCYSLVERMSRKDFERRYIRHKYNKFISRDDYSDLEIRE